MRRQRELLPYEIWFYRHAAELFAINVAVILTLLVLSALVDDDLVGWAIVAMVPALRIGYGAFWARRNADRLTPRRPATPRAQTGEPSNRLAARVRADFDDATATRVLARIRALRSADGEEETERLQAAAVRAADGGWWRFEEAMELATIDFRDLLVAAELADDDWPDRLDGYLGPEQR